jgi:hypothetical protein
MVPGTASCSSFTPSLCLLSVRLVPSQPEPRRVISTTHHKSRSCSTLACSAALRTNTLRSFASAESHPPQQGTELPGTRRMAGPACDLNSRPIVTTLPKVDWRRYNLHLLFVDRCSPLRKLAVHVHRYAEGYFAVWHPILNRDKQPSGLLVRATQTFHPHPGRLSSLLCLVCAAKAHLLHRAAETGAETNSVTCYASSPLGKGSHTNF